MTKADQGQVRAADDKQSIEITVALLMRRRKEFENEIKRLSAELHSLDRAIAALDEVIRPSGVGNSVRSRARRKGSLAAELRDMAIAELKRARRPLTRSQILEKVSDYGITIDKADPAKFLSRVLWRAPELVNDGNGYRLVSTTPDVDTSVRVTPLE